MKRILLLGFLVLPLILAPRGVLAAKGGVGNGGGTTEDGILYHSHSDRSYSGKDQFKGKGHAYGRNKTQDGQVQGQSQGKGKGKNKNNDNVSY